MNQYLDTMYTITPRPELAENLRGRVSADAFAALTQSTHYYINEEEDPNWNEADYLLRAKLAFLHSVRHDHDHLLPSDEEFQAAFGSADISAALFDRWFTISRQQTWRNLGNAFSLLAFSSNPALPTGSERVDAWLAKLRDWKGKPLIIGSVLFHSPGELQVSSLVHGSWSRPVLDVLVAAGAAGRFGNMVDDGCAGFLRWCALKNPAIANLCPINIPGAPWRDEQTDPYEWYDKVMALVASWEQPPHLINLDEFTISYKGELLWPESKRGQPKRIDPRTTRPDSPFLWGWYGIGLKDHRPGQGTYGCYAYESLPPVPVPMNGDFEWLRPAPEADRVIGNADSMEADLTQLLADNPPGLPAEFARFFRTPALWRKVRSCTDCYFQIDPVATPIPGGLGRLVRFLCDSQGCIYWSLHLSECGTKHTVVATYHFSGSGGKPHPRDITVCAESFEEFIFRFWIENELWYALHHEQPMPTFGKEYLAHYRP